MRGLTRGAHCGAVLRELACPTHGHNLVTGTGTVATTGVRRLKFCHRLLLMCDQIVEKCMQSSGVRARMPKTFRVIKKSAPG